MAVKSKAERTNLDKVLEVENSTKGPLAGPPRGLYKNEDEHDADRLAGWPKFKAWAAGNRK